jgi:Uri superfamily endonuclease
MHRFPARTRSLEEELLALADDSEDEEETLGQTDVSHDDHLFSERSSTLEEELLALADDSDDEEDALGQGRKNIAADRRIARGDEDEDEPFFDSRSSRSPSTAPTDVSYDDRRFPERTRSLEEELLALADDSEDEEETLGQTDVSYDDHLFSERSRSLEEELLALADDSDDEEDALEQTARITKRKRSGSIEGNASKKGKLM